MAFLGDSQVGFMTKEPDIGQNKSASRLMEAAVVADVLSPELMVEEVKWQRLDKDSIFRPEKVKFCFLRTDNLPAEHSLAMEWPGRYWSSSPPKMPRDSVEPVNT